MADKKSIGITVASVVLALLFLLTGVMKLAGNQVAQFEAWGYPAWFQYLIGAAETAAGVGFLIRKTRFHAAAAMIVVMVGALYTQFRAGPTAEMVVPAVVLLLSALVAKHSRG